MDSERAWLIEAYELIGSAKAEVQERIATARQMDAQRRARRGW